MKRAANVLLALAVILMGVGAVLFFRPHPVPPEKSPKVLGQGVRPPPGAVVTGYSPSSDPRQTTVLRAGADGMTDWPGAAALVGELNAPDRSARDDLDGVQQVVTQYRAVYKENPPGGLNAEITAALRGDNPRRLRFLPDGASRFNAAGEWLDRWGTPYFFHPLSGELLELRSAGPDRKLWTVDDIAPRVEGGPPL